jgi:hypothetical protein
MEDSEYIKCYLSVHGHNNFMYPSQTSALLIPGSDFIALSWLGGAAERLKPIKVLKSCLMPLQIDENIALGAQSPPTDEYVVVWIPENLIAPIAG